MGWRCWDNQRVIFCSKKKKENIVITFQFYFIFVTLRFKSIILCRLSNSLTAEFHPLFLRYILMCQFPKNKQTPHLQRTDNYPPPGSSWIWLALSHLCLPQISSRLKKKKKWGAGGMACWRNHMKTRDFRFPKLTQSEAQPSVSLTPTLLQKNDRRKPENQGCSRARQPGVHNGNQEIPLLTMWNARTENQDFWPQHACCGPTTPHG